MFMNLYGLNWPRNFLLPSAYIRFLYMKSNLIKTPVPAIVAMLLTSLVLPSPAYAAPRNAGTLTVDCDTGYLESETVNYFAIGDTFRIQNDEYQPCLILDPNNILTGEDDDHSGLGAGVLDVSATTGPITINAEGSFTITENGGTGNPGAVVTFRLAPAFFFTNSTNIGRNVTLPFSHLYEGVTLVNGTTVDATVAITQLVNLDPSEDFTLDGSTGAQIRTSIDALPNQDGYLEYTVSFHADNDPSTPITLTNFSVTVKDIDSLQYLAAQNVDSFILSETPATKLTSRSVGNTLFIEELNDIESESEDQDHWAVLSFSAASTVTIRLGSRKGGASFAVLFSSTSSATGEFSNPSITEAQGTPAAPATTATPTPAVALAATGANVEGLMVAGLFAVVAGSGFLVFSRRKRIW
jgi:LPXTG-motif cell wall-anchored protein